MKIATLTMNPAIDKSSAVKSGHGRMEAPLRDPGV